MKSLIETGFYYISGHGRGWAFSPSDLQSRFSRQQADTLLSALAAQGKIRRVARGVYEYPSYSELLGKTLSPDIDQVARAYARKFGWRIEVSGNTALNLLGLSNQIPATYLYLSDGPSRSYDILGQTLEFKKSALKTIGFKYRESMLLVQALKALGNSHVGAEVINKVKQQFEPSQRAKILRDTRGTTSWIYEVIKTVCQD
ncbi:MAG: DUF6088 family protein [Gammaproteobacteria bacterium]|nr:DUF6088 family protein [Gammaproteobacteria bacterium]